MNHQLRHEKQADEITSLRGTLVQQVQAVTSDRFTAVPSVDTPTMWITDTTTERAIQVPLFVAREVLKALDTLFGEDR